MAEDFKGTSIDKGKGEAEFSEVEELIRQTLEENKKVSEKPAATPFKPSPVAVETKKEEFKATSLPPAPKPAEKPKPAAKEKAAPPPPPSGYEATFKEYKAGDIVRGKVLKVDPSGVLVDINYKADGLIPTEELSDRQPGSPEEVVKVGDVISVYIENIENKEGYVVLSKRRADYERKWKFALDAYHKRTLLSGKVLQALKGGLVVDCDGIRGFVPASQVTKTGEESLDAFVGRVISLKVIEVNQRQGKIVLSNKMAAGEKEKSDTDKILNELEVGQVRRGKVKNLKTFGAFVDLGGVEGLIHLSELSWKRVKHPSEVLKSGDEIDVFVLGVDRTNKKVSLGLKELQPDPWVNAAELYKPKQIVKAKILRFAKFGAFAELEHGLEGLIHISELSIRPVQNPGDAVKIGDVVDVKILRVLPEEQRIGLSIKDVLLEREKKAAPPKEPTTAPTAEEKKITIGDMIAEKERARAEKEAEEAESEEEGFEEVA
ncbi:MAG: 30S ribosomal protein S1 [Candidatus Margulisbacteria bacterium]|nr:30S ribosomal protein S1 [Candidatus Margulisiibacteriota bacterium]